MLIIHYTLCIFQGNIAIYRLGDGEASEVGSDTSASKKAVAKTKAKDKPKLKLMTNLPSSKPHEVHIMVYIVKVGRLFW